MMDDCELIIRTFLNGKMTKIDKILYIQHEDKGKRGESGNNTQSIRYGEIQRFAWYLKRYYDKKIHENLSALYKDLRKEETNALLDRLVLEPKDISNLIRILFARELESDAYLKLKEAFLKLKGEELNDVELVGYEQSYMCLFFQHFNLYFPVIISVSMLKYPCMQTLFRRTGPAPGRQTTI